MQQLTLTQGISYTMGQKQPPLCVCFDILDEQCLKGFAKEGYLALRQSVTSLNDAYKLCQIKQRTVICLWQKNIGRLGIVNHKAVLEPRSSMPIPLLELVKHGEDKHPQMVESSKSLTIPTTYYIKKEKRGYRGVAMIEYITNYDELTHKFDQRNRSSRPPRRQRES